MHNTNDPLRQDSRQEDYPDTVLFQRTIDIQFVFDETRKFAKGEVLAITWRIKGRIYHHANHLCIESAEVGNVFHQKNPRLGIKKIFKRVEKAFFYGYVYLQAFIKTILYCIKLLVKPYP